MSSYEYIIVRGIPYYKKSDGDITRLLTFEQNGTPVDIGTYEKESDSVNFLTDWKERVASNLTKFREGLSPVQRDKLRENIKKPTKQRKTPRNSRKTTRTKTTKSE
jgi:hypothetical protein